MAIHEIYATPLHTLSFSPGELKLLSSNGDNTKLDNTMTFHLYDSKTFDITMHCIIIKKVSKGFERDADKIWFDIR